MFGCASASSAMVGCERAKSIRKEELEFVAKLQGVNARKVCGLATGDNGKKFRFCGGICEKVRI